MLNHRDALGIPRGCNEYPYFMCTNDLCAIANSFLEMVLGLDDSHGCKLEIIHDMPNVLKLLIKSYDDGGCCGFRHSMDKDVFVRLRTGLVAACGRKE